MFCFDNPTLKRGKLKFQDQCSAGHASRPMPAVLCPAGPIRGRYHKIFLMRRPKHIFLYLKWANLGLFLVYFRSFQTQFYRKNCRLQQDSNLDRQSRRQARWPLDHHHGPTYLSLFWSFQQFRLNKLPLKNADGGFEQGLLVLAATALPTVPKLPFNDHPKTFAVGNWRNCKSWQDYDAWFTKVFA